jgi:hypothetical protein
MLNLFYKRERRDFRKIAYEDILEKSHIKRFWKNCPRDILEKSLMRYFGNIAHERFWKHYS